MTAIKECMCDVCGATDDASTEGMTYGATLNVLTENCQVSVSLDLCASCTQNLLRVDFIEVGMSERALPDDCDEAMLELEFERNRYVRALEDQHKADVASEALA
jgi:hypothetical protein